MAAPFRVGDHLEVKIESLSYNGGRGVARHQGFVLFVPFAAPDELLSVRIKEIKKNFATAEIISILTPSPSRRNPPCPVVGRCGGCSWQHVDYQEQLKQKQIIVAQSLRPLEKYGPFKINTISPSAKEFRYRNRIQLQVQHQQVGYFARDSNNLIAIEDCWLAEDTLAAQIPQQKTAPPGRIELALQPNGELRRIVGQRPADLHLFSQVNSEQNLKLIEIVCTLCQPLSPQQIIDLYCGDGNLTEPLAICLPNSRITGVDISHTAIALAKAKALAANQSQQIEYLAVDVNHYLLNCRSRPDVVVLDPPRIGATHKVMSALLQLAPQSIIYVSCNPTTFARDAATLLDQGKYQLCEITPVDMFPQTEHVELVALFKKIC